MEIKKSILILAFLITCSIFFTILLVSTVFDNTREDVISTQSQEVYKNIDEVQKFMLMSDVYGAQMACIAFKAKLQDLDKGLWDLGIKLENYRVASEQFQKDPYYLEQKKIFNENEVLYLMLLTKIKNQCNYNQAVISFFYRNSEDCKKCDDQSFVLTDIKKDLKDDVSIFSFDKDLNMTTINLLTEYYEVDQYPCLVIDEKKFCGMLDKKFIIEKICDLNKNISVCNKEHA